MVALYSPIALAAQCWANTPHSATEARDRADSLEGLLAGGVGLVGLLMSILTLCTLRLGCIGLWLLAWELPALLVLPRGASCEELAMAEDDASKGKRYRWRDYAAWAPYVVLMSPACVMWGRTQRFHPKSNPRPDPNPNPNPRMTQLLLGVLTPLLGRHPPDTMSKSPPFAPLMSDPLYVFPGPFLRCGAGAEHSPLNLFWVPPTPPCSAQGPPHS